MQHDRTRSIVETKNSKVINENVSQSLSAHTQIQTLSLTHLLEAVFQLFRWHSHSDIENTDCIENTEIMLHIV